MASRARLLLATSLVVVPSLVWSDACGAHNGRDLGYAAVAAAHSPATRTPQGVLIDIFDGIEISVDPRTGVRTYTQVGDIPANPGRAEATVTEPSVGPGVSYWVEKSFAANNSPSYPPSPMIAPEPEVSVYDEGYADYGYGYGYGGYLGYGYGGGGGHHRPGHGHDGDGRPGRPGGGDGHPGGGGPQPAARVQGPRFSPPPGPYGGGVGSPPPYFDAGVGAPPPPLRYNGYRGRRG